MARDVSTSMRKLRHLASWKTADTYFVSVPKRRKRRREWSRPSGLASGDVSQPSTSKWLSIHAGGQRNCKYRILRRSLSSRPSTSLFLIACLFIHCCIQSPSETDAFTILGTSSQRRRESHRWASNPSSPNEPRKKQQSPKTASDQKLMAIKRKAISALSQPVVSDNAPRMGNAKQTKEQRNGSGSSNNKNSRRKTGAVSAKKRNVQKKPKAKRRRNLRDDPRQPKKSGPKRKPKASTPPIKDSSSPPTSFTSLLPPTNRNSKRKLASLNSNNTSGEESSNNVPFWEQFLELPSPEQPPSNSRKKINSKPLPSIEDLFPAAPASVTTDDAKSPTPSTLPSIDGVLPVAELFYRSDPTDSANGNNSTANAAASSAADDEELPFSKKQSDAVVTPKRQPRRIVRRGMEMLVGGVPINADPPMRSLQLGYDSTRKDWASVIGTNTNKFGPLLHAKNAAKVTDVERGLYCEYFRFYTNKWNVCPEDLQVIGDDALSSSSSSSSTPEPAAQYELTERKDVIDIEGEFSMDMAIPRHEFLACEGEEFPIFRDVLTNAFRSVLAETAEHSTARDESDGFDIQIPTLSLVESSIAYGYSHLHAVVKVAAGFDARGTKLYRRVKKISAAFVKAMDDDDIAVSIAEAARNETRWPEQLRQRVVEDCLFGDMEDRDDAEDEDVLLIPEPQSLITNINAPASSLFEEQQQLTIGKADLRRQRELFRGSGKEGAYPDYSAPNVMNSPYQGQIGLRLVDAVIERAKMRQPRVIAIGDVHGCIDELQELLRLCDYRPGDLVLFLGDLVCKGPDSLSVVQMAREIGAIGVRGNHDFEVVRWHQAILAGIDRPVFGSEHFYIATCLSKADLKWLYSLPWFVSSKSLDSLFVHAGFVAGIRLSKQNPRLMLNMRSILPDGTVTSKYFTNWPWARLWDGPSTVYFGHDADRGLQQWPNAVGLDTGCVYGGRLTAMLLPERRLVSTPAKREYFKYRRKHFH